MDELTSDELQDDFYTKVS